MAKTGDNPTPANPPTAATPGQGTKVMTVADVTAPPGWGQLWQMPVLLIGFVLFGVGLYLSMTRTAGPDMNGVLDDFADTIKAANYDRARELVDVIDPRLRASTLPQQARFSVLNADLIFLEQRAKGWDKPTNHERIMALYEQAVKLGYNLEGYRQQRWAETLVAMDRYPEALEMLMAVKDDTGKPRHEVIRWMIERSLARGSGDVKSLEPIIQRFEADLDMEKDRASRRTQRIWAATVRGRLQLQAEQGQKLIDELQVQIIRFMDEGKDDDLAPLLVLLGQAYQNISEYSKAMTHYRLAQQTLRPGDPDQAELAARILVGLGQLTLANPDHGPEVDAPRAALEYFMQAETEFRSTDAYLDALFGRAGCEARLGMHHHALDHFRAAVSKMTESQNPAPRQVQQAIELLRRQHVIHYDRGEYALALDYLKLLNPVYGDPWPAEPLMQLADTYFALALQTEAESQQAADGKSVNALAPSAEVDESQRTPVAPDSPRTTPVRSLRAQLRIDAARLYEQAGDLYARHATVVTIKDVREHSDSLWKSAHCYEKAQLWRKAIDVLLQFAKAMPGDPRQLQAMHRLGMAHLADRQFAVAADFFRRIIDDHPRSPKAHESHVPLARSLIALNRPDEAMVELQRVVTDHPALKPDSNEYRNALVELGRLHYRLKQFEPAIQRMSEANERYGKGDEGPTVRFIMADAYRQSVPMIEQTLRQQLPLSRRQALAAERARRLEQAQKFYSQVVVDLESRKPETLSEMERLYRRNAYFYRADCAYDLGRFDQAITLYDAAVKRFDADPSSLMALVQIVNAYCEMGRLDEARVANDRARAQLKRIPEEAFNDPSLPMNRRHWEDWLKFTSQFNLFSAAQADATPRR